MTQRLGGWARLGLVLSVLWTLMVGVMALTSMPQRPTPPAPSYANTTPSDGRTVYDPQTSEFVTRDEAERRMAERRAAMTPEGRVAADASAELTRRFESSRVALENESQARGQDWRQRRRALVQFLVVIWLTPIAAMYAVGYSARWIYRGFKQK